MTALYFENAFSTLPIPVVVAKKEPGFSVVYANKSARLLLNPLLTVKFRENQSAEPSVDSVLPQQRDAMVHALSAALDANGHLNGFHMTLVNFEGKAVPVNVDANTVAIDGSEYHILYLRECAQVEDESPDGRLILSTLFQLTSDTNDLDKGIHTVLAYVGTLVQVSRTYIFEETSPEDTANTYEWCAPGIEPAIQDLQSLKKTDYNYDTIVNGGMYITDDVDDLPKQDRDILAAQGIKALAILPLIHMDKALGYLGFDDCASKRRWSSAEVQTLKIAADFILSLIVRRNAETKLLRSSAVLKTITDSIENVIYVNDVRTHELVFLNKPLMDSLGIDAEVAQGRPCWEVLQVGMEGMCDFCPVPQMLEEGYDTNGRTFTWEFQNTRNERWYLLKDSIIEWTDGRLVHIETATEITHQKHFEEQLMQYASTDMMTGTYNREWGHRILRETRYTAAQESGEASLLFLDVDGLKAINDTYGHDVGDEVLINTVNAVRACIRKSDVICRWGGDEFLLLLKCSEDIAERIVRKIYAKLDTFNRESAKPYKLGFSYGIASLTDSPDELLDTIIARADKRMYENKIARRAAAMQGK